MIGHGQQLACRTCCAFLDRAALMAIPVRGQLGELCYLLQRSRKAQCIAGMAHRIERFTHYRAHNRSNRTFGWTSSMQNVSSDALILQRDIDLRLKSHGKERRLTSCGATC